MSGLRGAVEVPSSPREAAALSGLRRTNKRCLAGLVTVSGKRNGAVGRNYGLVFDFSSFLMPLSIYLRNSFVF
jgi:hypothetical protein